MHVPGDTYGTRRHLPHLQRIEKTYYVSFATLNREVLSPTSRSTALACCVFGHLRTYWLETAIIMPDHVHLVLMPYPMTTLPRTLKLIKGVSSRLINIGRRLKGRRWQDESFDRIVRAGDNLAQKCEYIRQNPVRWDLVDDPDDYPWLWRSWVDAHREQEILSVLPDWLIAKRPPIA